MFAALCGSGFAEAAPWVREEGGWYARALGARDSLDKKEGWRVDLYGEYGLTPKLTVTAKSEAVTYPGATEFDQEFGRLTLRRELSSHKGWTAGVEAGPFYGGTSIGLHGCDSAGFETRAGAGWSGQYKGKNLHAFSDVAYLAQGGGCSRMRIEMGYGQDLSERVFMGQQLWYEVGDRTARSVKTETQLGLHFTQFDLSLGYREEIGGAFNENAVLIAVVMRR